MVFDNDIERTCFAFDVHQRVEAVPCDLKSCFKPLIQMLELETVSNYPLIFCSHCADNTVFLFPSWRACTALRPR